MKRNETDDLDLQFAIAGSVLLELSRLLRDRGYDAKAAEAEGAAQIAEQWRREYRKETKTK